MRAGEDDRSWIEHELAELRVREAHYRERLGRSDAEIARFHAHSEALYQLVRRRFPVHDDGARILGDVAKLSAQALHVSRASVWLFDADLHRLSCKVQLVDGREEPCSDLTSNQSDGSVPSTLRAAPRRSTNTWA